MWFLLAGRVSWRKLYPCAVTTGAFWMRMLAVFAAILSGMIISYDQGSGSGSCIAPVESEVMIFRSGIKSAVFRAQPDRD